MVSVIVELNDPEDDRPSHQSIDEIGETLANLGMISKRGNEDSCHCHGCFKCPKDCAGYCAHKVDADGCICAEDREIRDRPVDLVHDALVRRAVLHEVIDGSEKKCQEQRYDER